VGPGRRAAGDDGGDLEEITGGLSALPVEELAPLVTRLEAEMRKAATDLRYEEAALLRDEIAELRLMLVEASDGAPDPVPSA